jgi:two-component system phosphate regulon response regulator PhoB
VGFELGAEDYVNKPFSPRELVLRVKAILKWIELPKESEKLIQIEGLLIGVERHHVSVNKKPIPLTHTEFKLLLELVQKEAGSTPAKPCRTECGDTLMRDTPGQ